MLANDAVARAAALRLPCRARSRYCASIRLSASVGHAFAHAGPPECPVHRSHFTTVERVRLRFFARARAREPLAVLSSLAAASAAAASSGVGSGSGGSFSVTISTAPYGQASTQFLNGLRELPYLAKGETCPAAAELMGRLAEEKPAHSRARSQLAFALLCELADADSAAPALPPLVQAAIEDIRANYAGLYGVEELSERLGVSKSHLVRTFTASVGVPPGKYLTTVRIEAAQRLLLHREYTLDVVASLCGFSGANYLCRVFKKETGQSPAQWRALTGRAAQSGLTPEETMREQEMYI